MLTSMSERTPEQIKAASPEIEPDDDYVEAAAIPDASLDVLDDADATPIPDEPEA